MKRTHKLLSILLTLALLLGMVPVTAAAVEPDVVVSHDVDQIRELLRQDGDVSIKLDADAEKDLDYDKAAAEAQNQEADLDGDGFVNYMDLFILLDAANCDMAESNCRFT